MCNQFDNSAESAEEQKTCGTCPLYVGGCDGYVHKDTPRPCGGSVSGGDGRPKRSEPGEEFERVLNGPAATIALISSLNTDVAKPLKDLVGELTTAHNADMQAIRVDFAQARDTAQYWKAEHIAGNKLLAEAVVIIEDYYACGGIETEDKARSMIDRTQRFLLKCDTATPEDKKAYGLDPYERAAHLQTQLSAAEAVRDRAQATIEMHEWRRAAWRTDNEAIKMHNAALLDISNTLSCGKPPVCEWKEYDGEEMPGTFKTSCGNMFSFVEGGIAENQTRYCQYCGKKIEEVKK